MRDLLRRVWETLSRRAGRCPSCGARYHLDRRGGGEHIVHAVDCVELVDGVPVWVDVGEQRMFLGSIKPGDGPTCWQLLTAGFLDETAREMRRTHRTHGDGCGYDAYLTVTHE